MLTVVPFLVFSSAPVLVRFLWNSPRTAAPRHVSLTKTTDCWLSQVRGVALHSGCQTNCSDSHNNDMTQRVDGWMDGWTDGRRRGTWKCDRMRRGRRGMSGISEQDESVTGGDGYGGGVAKKTKQWAMVLSSLGGKKKTKKTPPSSAAAIAGQSWRWKSCFTPSSPLSHLFSHIWMWFLVIFQALWTDSQTQRLRNYVLVPEHDTRAQDVAADKVCTDKHTDSSEKKKKKNLHVARSVLGSRVFARRCPLSPSCHAFSWRLLLLTHWHVNHTAVTLRGELESGFVEIRGLTLALPTCYPTTAKCPTEKSVRLDLRRRKGRPESRMPIPIV